MITVIIILFILLFIIYYLCSIETEKELAVEYKEKENPKLTLFRL